MKLSIKTGIIFILLTASISGCLPKTEIPENSPVISENKVLSTTKPTNTPIPTETQRLTNTNSPTPEPTKISTFTITPSITPQPTENVFEDAVVLNIGYLGNNVLLVAVEATENLIGEYYALIDSEEFQCKILEEYLNRLYCNGSATKAGRPVVFKIFSNQHEEPIFQTEIIVPQIPTSTPKPSGGGNNPKETDDKPVDTPWVPPTDEPGP